jgi:hypothetical protein
VSREKKRGEERRGGKRRGKEGIGEEERGRHRREEVWRGGESDGREKRVGQAREEKRRGEEEREISGGAHGVALNQKAGASAPPLFGLRHFPVELAGLRGVFVARLRRGNFLVCTSSSFFGLPVPSKLQCGPMRPLLKKNSPPGGSPPPPPIPKPPPTHHRKAPPPPSHLTRQKKTQPRPASAAVLVRLLRVPGCGALLHSAGAVLTLLSLPYSHKKINIRFVPGFYKPRLAEMKGRKKRRAEGHTGKNLHKI